MVRPTLDQARAQYVHRYTMEHIPEWAKSEKAQLAGHWCGPHYRTDLEWYDHTEFGEHGCRSTGQTYPLGQWLGASPQQVIAHLWRGGVVTPVKADETRVIYHAVTEGLTITFLTYDDLVQFLSPESVAGLSRRILVCESNLSEEEYERVLRMRD